MNIGIAGIGRMGSAIAERLIEKGCHLAVWNRNPAAVNGFIRGNAKLVPAPAELWRHCDIIVSSLSDDQALVDVYLGADGLLGASAAGRLILDTSTVLPETVMMIGREAERHGCQFLDSPVLGTVAPARQGQLIAMVGGGADAFDRALPLLRLITRKVRYLGPTGSGAATKLAVNIPMAVYWAALSESLALADRYGLGRDDVLDIIGDSPAALAQFPLKLDILTGRSAQVGFAIEGVVKDLRVIREAAGHTLTLPLVTATYESFGRAVSLGAGAEDVAAITLHHAELY